MIAFHLVISAYGFWLPNDPRGSWSEFVAAWELLRFGNATKVSDGRSYARDPHDIALRRAAKEALKFPPVRFNDDQRCVIGKGFAKACIDSDYDCFACCIGYDHAHIVCAATTRSVNQIAGHLKALATRALSAYSLHPLAIHVGKRGGTPSPWSEGCWKVFIDDLEQLRNAIAYVERHPHKERLASQCWSFVKPVDPASLAAFHISR